jgi:hypothetical protein
VALRGILEEVGYADVLIARETNDGLQLIDGHLRAEMTPDQKVPVLVLDVDEAEADKLLASLDPVAGLAGVDEARLDSLLGDINAEHEGLRSLLDGLRPGSPKEGRTAPDDVPEPDEPVTRPGDLWVLGEHRLLCGDATDPQAVARVCAGDSVQLVVTSPPYNCSIEYESHDDDMPVDQYLELVRKAAEAAARVLADGCFVAWNVGVTPKSRHFEHARILEAVGLQFYRQIVWTKAGVAFPIWQYTTGARKYHPNYCHEVIYLYSKGKPTPGGRCEIDDAYSRDVWTVHQSAATRDLPGVTNGRRPRAAAHGGSKAAAHPAAYPVGIPAGAIRHLTSRGEAVLDPFSGAGTTLIACEQLGRAGRAIEIDPGYVDVAVRRWESFVGDKATRPE